MSMRRRAGVWKWVLIIVGGITFLFVVLLAALNLSGNAKWQSYVAARRAMGDLLTFEEMEAKRTEIPDGKNGARILEPFFDPLTVIARDKAKHVLGMGSKPLMADLQNGVPQYVVMATEDYLAKHASLLAGLDGIRSRPTGRFPIPYDSTDPIGTLLPYMEPVRAAARLEYGTLILDLLEKDFDGAGERIHIMLNLAGTLHDDPNLIGLLVRQSIEVMAVQGIEDGLIAGSWDVAILKSFEERIEQSLQAPSIEWAIRGSRACFLDTCEALKRGQSNSIAHLVSWKGTANLLPLYSLGFVLRSNQIVGARLHDELIDAKGDYASRLAAYKAMEGRWWALSSYHLVAKSLIPHFSHAIELDAEHRALLESARCALAAERFRLKNGRFPNELNDLVPVWISSIPDDPITAQPLRFDSTGDGIVFYSVGADGVNNLATLLPRRLATWEHSSKGSDIGFRLLPPEKRGVVILDVPSPEDAD